MSEIVVRRLQPGDEDGYFDVLAMTYNDGQEVPAEGRQFNYARPYVAEMDGRVVGIFSVLDLTCTRGPALLGHGGIAGVAVLPEVRRSGVGAAMMHHAIRAMGEDGLQVSSLYAFRESWYRRFGWEVAGKRIEVSCPTHRLPKVASDLPVRRLTPNDWAIFEPCYEAWAHERSGLSHRTPLLWKRFLNENRPNAIYAAGDPVEGYVALAHKIDFWAPQRLTEVCWSTPRGYQACLEMLHQIGSNKSAIEWYEPSDSPFMMRYIDQAVQTRVHRPAMFRVTDVPGALTKLVPSSDGAFTIAVKDHVIPENEGPWRVEFDVSGVRVEKASQAEITLDIRAFTQGFLGDPSFIDLARNGLLECANAASLDAAMRLMPALPVYCAEFF